MAVSRKRPIYLALTIEIPITCELSCGLGMRIVVGAENALEYHARRGFDRPVGSRKKVGKESAFSARCWPESTATQSMVPVNERNNGEERYYQLQVVIVRD